MWLVTKYHEVIGVYDDSEYFEALEDATNNDAQIILVDDY